MFPRSWRSRRRGLGRGPRVAPAHRAHAREVADTIETHADTAGLTTAQRTGVQDAVRYLRRHADYLHYDKTGSAR